MRKGSLTRNVTLYPLQTLSRSTTRYITTNGKESRKSRNDRSPVIIINTRKRTSLKTLLSLHYKKHHVQQPVTLPETEKNHTKKPKRQLIRNQHHTEKNFTRNVTITPLQIPSRSTTRCICIKGKESHKKTK